MSENSARLGLPYIAPAQAQKHVTHNEALQQLDTVVQLTLEATDAMVPPAMPELGAVYALSLSPTDAWAGQGGMLAHWLGQAWLFVAPKEGWHAWDKAANAITVFDGTNWVDLSAYNNLNGLGIGTSYDAVNRLAVAADAALFTHESGDIRLTMNKAAAAETASLLYQSGWSGRAEVGLTGDDDLHVKVSPDGSNWTEALVIDGTSGLFSGDAVQADQGDTTPGRLMVNGAHGLGTVSSLSLSAGDNLDAVDRLGFDRYQSSTAGAPTNAGIAMTLVRIPTSSVGGIIQTAFSDDGRIFTRVNTGTGPLTWTDWTECLSYSGLLGPVSEVGGVPTGSVIEHGSNANGRYTRWADGTQICWIEDITLSYSNGTTLAETWNFPAQFSARPAVTFSRASAAGAHSNVGRRDLGASLSAISAIPFSSVDLFTFALPGVTIASGAFVSNNTALAVGRWF